MKKLPVIAAAIFWSCQLPAQGGKQIIEGNGNLVTRDMPVGSFDRLDASGLFVLRLSQGNREQLRIEADENLQEMVEVSNENGRLNVKMKKMKDVNLKTKNNITVHITFRQLKEMNLKMLGRVVSENELRLKTLVMKNSSIGEVDLKLNVSDLRVENTGIGNLHLEGKAEKAVMMNSGIGNLDAGSLVIQELHIENTGIGNAEVNAEKSLKVKDSSLGKVRNKGAATPRKLNRVRV